MERSEPALAPEWLRVGTAGSSSNNGGHSNQQSGLSSRAGDRGYGGAFGNRSSLSASDHDICHGSSSLKRATSSNSRRSASTNGFVAIEGESPNRRPYSSFGRNREKDYNRHKKDRALDDRLDDSFTNFLAARDDKGNLTRSQSMIARRNKEQFPKKHGTDSSSGLLLPGSPASSTHSHKASFDRDFPSLGSDERQSSHEIGRIPSPGLSIASAGSLVGHSVTPRADSWTSALADVPAGSVGNGALHVPLHSPFPTNTVSSVSTSHGYLNMAETLAQAPLRTRVAPDLSMETQRLEELAIKQSRQLIPVTPSTSKAMVANSSDKLKGKLARSGDTFSIKVPTPLSPQALNSTPRAPSRSESSKGSQVGNFQVLNRDRSCLHANSKEGSNSGELPLMPSNAKPKVDMKSRPMNGSSDKRPLHRSQDRTDFFNSLRKKVNADQANACQEKDSNLSVGKSDEQIAINMSSDCQDIISLAHPDSTDLHMQNNSQNGVCDECKESKLSSPDSFDDDDTLYSEPTEEEFKFLNELGWKKDENVEQITDEEIESFRREHMNKVSSSSTVCPLSQQ